MIRPLPSPSRRLWLGLGIVVAAVALPVAWYLASPLFINYTVDEQFPTQAMPTEVQPASSAVEGARAVAEPAAALSGAVAEPAAGRSEAAMEPAAARSEAASPKTLGSGQFGEIDAIHKGEGTAAVFQLPDGQRVLRFSDFKVTNGPDLFVYLSGHPAPRDGGQLHQPAAFEVARLKGNIGSQNYELPADLDLSRFKSVVIYCKRFSVVFSTAELATS